jgi:hypothetical protein
MIEKKAVRSLSLPGPLPVPSKLDKLASTCYTSGRRNSKREVRNVYTIQLAQMKGVGGGEGGGC